MRLFLLLLLPAFGFSQSYIGKSYKDCVLSFSGTQYDIIERKDTIYATHQIVKNKVLLTFDKGSCIQEVEYHSYLFLKKTMEDISSEDWSLIRQLEDGALLYKNPDYYMIIGFQPELFMIDTEKKGYRVP